MSTRGRTLLVLAILAAPGAAQAQEGFAAGCPKAAAASTRPRSTALGLDVGLASAVGFAGVTLTRALGDCFRIELGGGYGFTGWQLSFMPKVVLGEGRDHFVAGVGVSISFPDENDSVLDATGHPVWINVDMLGYEHRFDSGFAVSMALGATVALGGGQICTAIDGCIPSDDLHDVAWTASPQTRIELAYWF